MKNPKILIDFQDLIGEEIVCYVEKYYDCIYYSIIITKNKNIFMFNIYSGMGDACIDNESIDGINRFIITYKDFKELLLMYNVIDDEYANKLLNEKEMAEKKLEESKRQKKLKQYNKLKQELGIN